MSFSFSNPALPESQHGQNKPTEHALVEAVQPVIAQVVRSRLRLSAPAWQSGAQERQEGEDLQAETLLHLLQRLHQPANDTQLAPIEDLSGYAAAVAHQVCNAYLRRKYPQRAQLSDQLRYVLTHQPGLALWESPTQPHVCGFAAWRGRAPLALPLVQRRFAEPESFWQGLPQPSAAARKPGNLAIFCAHIFDFAGAPLEFQQLVQLVASLRGLTDQPFSTIKEYTDSEERDQRVTAVTKPVVDERLYVGQVWEAIGQLSHAHRTALLLNLGATHERGLLVAFVELGIVSIPQIADVLALTPIELAALWNDLPLPDVVIAQRLGCTRQQVINLRSSARRQLTQRLELNHK